MTAYLNTRALRFLAAAFLLAVLVGVSTGRPIPASAEPANTPPADHLTPPVATSSVGGVVTFSSAEEDIWGAAADGDTWELINAEWDESDSFEATPDFIGDVSFEFDRNNCENDLLHCISNLDDFVSFGEGESTIGIGSSFGVAGHIKLFAETVDLQGTASVTYPGQAIVEYPSADSFIAGQTVVVGASWAQTSGSAINANESSGDLQLIFDMRLAADLDVTAFFPSINDLSDSASTTVFDFDVQHEVVLFSLSAFDGVPAVPPLPFFGVGGNIKPFSITPTAQSADPSGEISVTGTNVFSNFIFDLGKMASSPVYPIGGVPLGDNLDLRAAGVPVVLGYDIFDADANVFFTATQTLTFTPTVQIKLNFATAPTGITGAYDSKAGDNSWVIFEPGAEIGIEFPPGQRDAIDIDPQVLLGGTLRNESHLGTNSNIVVLAGRYDYQLPEFEIFPELGPWDTGLDWPDIQLSDHWHDAPTCHGCFLHIHGLSDHWHDGSILGIPCDDCILHVHGGDHWHDVAACTECLLHVHSSTTWRDIVVGPWGPVNFPGLDITLDPLWGPETYAESQGPDTPLADETFSVTFAPISLSSFSLEPNDAPEADAGGPYVVDEGSSVNLTAALSTDEEVDPLTFAWDLDGNGSFETAGSVVSFNGIDGPSDPTVTLQVCDPYTCDETNVTVHVDNVTPTAEAGAGQTVYRNEVFSVEGSWTDPAGPLDDLYTWSWDLAVDDSGTAAYGSAIARNTSLPLEGFYDLTFGVSDKDGGFGADTVTIEVLNRPPDCSSATPSVDSIWSVNHKMSPINVFGVTDPEGDATTITITGIWQDEPVSANGSGNSEPSGSGIGTDTALVRAERAGTKKSPGNGRVYEISYIADDGHGGQCGGSVSVGIPHDQGKGSEAVNDGAVYNSTAP